MWRRLAVSLTFLMCASAAVKIEKIDYRGWPNSYRLSNEEVELVVLTDVGPRILRYGFIGGQNLLKEFEDQIGKSGETSWQARGGHRLWMSPEDPHMTYALDNSPIEMTEAHNGISLMQAVEKESGLQKQMIIRLAPSGTSVEVLHRIVNKSGKNLHFAPWALTMMAQGGTGITGFPPRGSHDTDLAATNPLTMWSYTNFSDERWRFTKKYLILHQDPKNHDSQKTGLFNKNMFGAYLLGTDLFIKRAQAGDVSKYPDFGCSYETYTDDRFLELETLGELQDVAPGASVEHVEHWSLHKNVHIAQWTDDELDRVLLPWLK